MSDITDAIILPDGSAVAIASFPLPSTHWLYADREYDPGAEEPKELPAPILTHAQRAEVVAAVRYAIRGATMCGKELDFDPDALVQNAVYALCGPFTSQEGRESQSAPADERALVALAVQHHIRFPRNRDLIAFAEALAALVQDVAPSEAQPVGYGLRRDGKLLTPLYAEREPAEQWASEFACEVVDLFDAAPQAGVQAVPIPLSTIREWAARRLRACGQAGVTDQVALLEEAVRWAEGQHDAQPSGQAVPSDTHAFKNFHRALCDRFGYSHDERDWRRDQVSLIEWIAAQQQGGAVAAALAQARQQGYEAARAEFDVVGLAYEQRCNPSPFSGPGSPNAAMRDAARAQQDGGEA